MFEKRTGVAHDGEHLAALDAEGDVLEDLLRLVGVHPLPGQLHGGQLLPPGQGLGVHRVREIPTTRAAEWKHWYGNTGKRMFELLPLSLRYRSFRC